MNQFTKEFIFKFKQPQIFPSRIVDNECLNYKDLIFEDNLQNTSESPIYTNCEFINIKNFADCFIIEDNENKDFEALSNIKKNKNLLNKNIENSAKKTQKMSSSINPNNISNSNTISNNSSSKTNWKSSKYVSNENNDKENEFFKSKYQEENKNKKEQQTFTKKEIKNTVNSTNDEIKEITQQQKNNQIYNEEENLDFTNYFISNKPSNSPKNKINGKRSSSKNLEKEIELNVESIIKKAIDDEDNNDSLKDLETNKLNTNEAAKKANKKKKKKNKNKSAKTSENNLMPNITSSLNNTTNKDEISVNNSSQINTNNNNNSIFNPAFGMFDLSRLFPAAVNPNNNFIPNNLNFNPVFFHSNNNLNSNKNQNLNDTMFDNNTNNYQSSINNSNMDNTLINNENLDSTYDNKQENINSNNFGNPNINPNHNHGMPLFQPNLIHPIFYGANAPKVIYPQIDPSKNLNFLIPNSNIMHPNLILEPVIIENIYLFNKKFNIAYDQNSWYIFNPLNTSMSLPLSSKQIFDMYNMKILHGEIDIRPIDIFQYLNKVAFSFMKLKTINDIDWVDQICDSQLLCYTELFGISEKIKGDFYEHENKNVKSEDNFNLKNIPIEVEEIKPTAKNMKNEQLKNHELDDFEVVGAKKTNKNNINKNAYTKPFQPKKNNEENIKSNNQNKNNLNSNNPSNLNSNNKEKKPFVIQNNNINPIQIKNTINPHSTTNSSNNVINNKIVPKKNEVLINNINMFDETLNFAESVIHPNKNFEVTNIIEDNREIIETLNRGENKGESDNIKLNNILDDADEDWEVVHKGKKKIQKEKEKQAALVSKPKVPEAPKEDLNKKKNEAVNESIDIVEKLKMKNPLYNNPHTNTKPLDSIETLITNNKFEVVAKKKKKKSDGKAKLPGMK